jgi:hypothetical protein
MGDGVRAVGVPTFVLTEIINLDNGAITQRVQARPLVRTVLDRIDLGGQVVAGRHGERLPAAAYGHAARGGRRHDISGQPHHLVEEGVDLGRVDEQAQQLTVRRGQRSLIGGVGQRLPAFAKRRFDRRAPKMAPP